MFLTVSFPLNSTQDLNSQSLDDGVFLTFCFFLLNPGILAIVELLLFGTFNIYDPI